jgi:RNA polymerase-associated protein RTF1
MDESDSDAAPNDYLDLADDDNPYPHEGKYRNSSDKAYVLGLTEVEREQLLADRAEEAQQKRRGQQLKSLLDSSAADKSKKRKAAAELEDERRPARAKTTREKALDAYKSTREQAREGRGKKQLGRSSRRSRSRSEASSRDASGSPDIQAGSRSLPKEPDLPVELGDIERVRVGRSRLAQVCFVPKFNDSMIGCFARVCIGQGSDRQNEYRMTTIKGIVTGQPYLVDASPAVPPFYTDQYVLLAHGKAQKQWPFNNCSDSKFTEREFNRWKSAIAADNLPLTTRSEANKTCDKIHALLNHRLTNEEVNEKVAKRDKYRHLFASSPANAPKATRSDDLAEKLMRRNEKARKETSSQIRSALAAKELKRRRLMEAKKLEHDAAKKAGVTSNGSDSLTVPKSDIDALFSEGSDVSRAASPALSELKSGAPAVQRSGTSTPTPNKHKAGRFAKMTMDDDVIGSMDLAIDIEI